MACFHNLPRELVIETLYRLPVKSLIRFKCVCKSWCTIINNPQFIAMHLKHSNNKNNNACVLFKHCYLKNIKEKENMFSLLSNDDLSVVNINMNLPLYKKEPRLKLLGHSDGIICLSNSGDDVVLCNPAIRQSRVLPKSSIPLPSNKNWDVETNALGFGYDHKSHDYKVVRVFSFWEERQGGGIIHPPKAEIYTLSTDSWREIKNVIVGAYVFYTVCFETYFNGVFYWWALADGDRKEVILSFEMGDEVFQLTPMPDYQPSDDLKYRSLLVWRGSVALIFYPICKAKKSFEICLMNGNGAKKSWTKVLSIGPLSGVERPFLFFNYDELLMEGINGKVVSYNLNTKKIKNVAIQGVPDTLAAVTYVKSLVSIKGGMKLPK